MGHVMTVVRKSSPGDNMTADPNVDLAGTPHLVFQPAVDLATGRLLGFEALLRWTDPSGRAVPPVQLIPQAETRGYMSALNAWVLAEACAQAARWPLNLQVAVNCSVFQLRRAEAALAAAAALEASGLRPDRLTVEVTGTTVTDAGAAGDLDTMARLGIQLTLDDLVSADDTTMAGMRASAVNTVKLDGSLVRTIDDLSSPSRTVVATIVGMTRSLGICSVAEAVETAAQADALRELGVEVAQGYYFSTPLSSTDALELAARPAPPVLPLPVGAQGRSQTHPAHSAKRPGRTGGRRRQRQA